MPWKEADRAKYDVIKRFVGCGIRVDCSAASSGQEARTQTDLRARAEGRDAAPTAVVVDSQSVKTTEAGGLRGAAKKIKGRKRHLAVDTLGLPIECQITPTNTQDRDALAPVLRQVGRKAKLLRLFRYSRFEPA